MNKIIAVMSLILLLLACTPVKNPISNEYRLSAFNQQQLFNHPSPYTILIGSPQAAAGYESSSMLYSKKPFALNAFAHNAWVDSPAQMLFPLIVKSLQKSGYFQAVASNTSADLTDYRLDTRLLELQQNFNNKPSCIELTVAVMLSRSKDNKIIASRIFQERVPTPMDTPYGGVLAANQATLNFTKQLDKFIIAKISS